MTTLPNVGPGRPARRHHDHRSDPDAIDAHLKRKSAEGDFAERAKAVLDDIDRDASLARRPSRRFSPRWRPVESTRQARTSEATEAGRGEQIGFHRHGLGAIAGAVSSYRGGRVLLRLFPPSHQEPPKIQKFAALAPDLEKCPRFPVPGHW